jgi:hypothetical protein
MVRRTVLYYFELLMFGEKFFVSGPVEIYVDENNLKSILVYEFLPYE